MRNISCLTALILAACAPLDGPTEPDPSRDTSAFYTPPAASGLIAVRPYPKANDVCQVIGENDITNRYLDDSATLIGCPWYETGALEDRVAEGAETLDRIGDWQLLSIPGQ